GEMYLAAYDRSGRFQSVEGTAEATTLADNSVDGVVAGQAFHWFNPERARTEFCRITKPNGWGALVWNSRKTDSSPFLRAYEALLREFGTDYAAIRHEDIATEIFEQFFGAGHIRHVLPNVQRFDLAGVTGRLLSSSYAPAAGHPRHEPMLAALATIFQEHACDGVVEFEYDTEIFAGRLC
ncbi:MAG: methyltransferase domain-containing protein, partial [Planctomycetaceae bacterium]